MKSFTIGTVFVLLALSGRVWADCVTDKPIGPRAVITCAAKEYLEKHPDAKGTVHDAATFWNNILFSADVMDKSCSKTAPDPDTQKAQAEMFKEVCNTQKGTYFSYDNFIAADEAISTKFNTKDTTGYAFMRSDDDYNLNLQELANFLATAAQETTGNAPGLNQYKTDGLYWRYETDFLLSVDPTNTPPEDTGSCKTYPANPGYISPGGTAVTGCYLLGLKDFKTNYYPLSTFVVAIKTGTKLVNTALVMAMDMQYNTAANTMTWKGPPGDPKNPTNFPIPQGYYPAPEGYTWQFLNQVIDPGYWVGMGAIQITGDSMPKFFGWHYQNIASGAPVPEADFPAFVKQFLTDGQLGWEGSLWYWNFRINGAGRPTLHKVLTNTDKPACHDIAITTAMTNGGCNHFEYRAKYYDYFKNTAFVGLSEKPVTAVYTDPDGNTHDVSSYTCDYVAPKPQPQPPKPQPPIPDIPATFYILDYCLSP